MNVPVDTVLLPTVIFQVPEELAPLPDTVTKALPSNNNPLQETAVGTILRATCTGAVAMLKLILPDKQEPAVVVVATVWLPDESPVMVKGLVV